MKRNFVIGLFGGLIGAGMLLILLSATGVVGAHDADVARSDVSRVESVASATLTSTFTYQGQLKNGGNAVTSLCDFQFGLWNSLSGGTQIGITQTVSGISVTASYFTALLNTGNQFGDTAFNGDARWLQTAVRCPTGGSYTPLSPRQQLTSLPFALPGLRTFPNATSPNIIGGFSGNSIISTAVGSTIGGGGQSSAANTINNSYSFIGGGFDNHVNGYDATIGGGVSNYANENYATVGGGGSNEANQFAATVGGGSSNHANRFATTVGGGYSNQANGDDATVGGGYANQANGDDATVGGGAYNIASGYRSTIPGGLNNQATMTYTFAAGYKAQAFHQGAFVWSDSTGTDFASTANDQFFVRASGGIYFFASPNAFGGGYCYLPANGPGWTCSSDRNLKEHFSAVDPQGVLQKLAAMPITQWNMKGSTSPHVGPMAQDFYAAFGLGEDDTHINSTDAQGVAFAAIQGLYNIAQEKDMQIDVLQKQNADMQTRLTNLEQNVPAGSPNWFSLIGIIALGVSGLTLLMVQRQLRLGGKS